MKKMEFSGVFENSLFFFVFVYFPSQMQTTLSEEHETMKLLSLSKTTEFTSSSCPFNSPTFAKSSLCVENNLIDPSDDGTTKWAPLFFKRTTQL